MIAFHLLEARFEALLQAGPAIADKVMRGKLRPISEQELTAVVVRYDRSSGSDGGVANGPTDWDSAFAFDCYSRDVDEPGQMAGGVLALVYERIFSAELSDLGVTSIFQQPEIVAGSSELDPDLACLTLFITVQHRTEGTSLTPRT